MKIGIIIVGIILALGYGERVLGAGQMISDSRFPISDIRFPISDIRFKKKERVLGAGQRVADSIVAVDPDKVRLEAALDPTVIIIDVRMKMEHRRGHIEKSVHLPKKKDLMEFASRTPLSRPIYVYCATEPRSRQAAKTLMEAGFERVFIIEGGFQKWKAYGLPVGKGLRPAQSAGRRAQSSG